MKTDYEIWINEESPIVGVLEAAWVLKVHPNTVYNMIRDGRLSATKVRGKWQILMVSLQCLSEQSDAEAE